MTVDDDGPGIPPHALERIFERFYTDRPNQGFGQNSGLGLSISRQIVEAHGGRIWAENRPGRRVGAARERRRRGRRAARSRHGAGARFVVSLPAIDAVSATPAIGWPDACMPTRGLSSAKRRAHSGAFRRRARARWRLRCWRGARAGAVRRADRRRPRLCRARRRPPAGARRAERRRARSRGAARACSRSPHEPAPSFGWSSISPRAGDAAAPARRRANVAEILGVRLPRVAARFGPRTRRPRPVVRTLARRVCCGSSP